MPMERVDSARDDARMDRRPRRDGERHGRMTAEAAGPTTSRTRAEEDQFGRLYERLSGKIERDCASVKAELSEKIERDCASVKAELFEKIERGDAHVTAVLSERIDGARELLDQRINDQARLFRTEIARLEDRIAHESGALRTEFGAVKELLLSRMEQQEKVRAAEYAATKWSLRSMMAAMALLVAMMARFTFLQ